MHWPSNQAYKISFFKNSGTLQFISNYVIIIILHACTQFGDDDMLKLKSMGKLGRNKIPKDLLAVGEPEQPEEPEEPLPEPEEPKESLPDPWANYRPTTSWSDYAGRELPLEEVEASIEAEDNINWIRFDDVCIEAPKAPNIVVNIIWKTSASSSSWQLPEELEQPEEPSSSSSWQQQ